MSSENQNLTTIQQLYTAFGQGDIHGVLSLVDTNATWANPYGKGHFPGQWGKPCRGHDEIANFFKDINEAVEVRGFNPYEMIVQGDKVVTLINWNGIVRKTGATFDVPLVHIWTVRDGKVVDYIGLDDATAYPF